MALTSTPDSPTTATLPILLIRAAAHRVDAPYWAVHTALGWVGYGVLYGIYQAATYVDDVRDVHAEAMGSHPRRHVAVLATAGATVLAAVVGIAVTR